MFGLFWSIFIIFTVLVCWMAYCLHITNVARVKEMAHYFSYCSRFELLEFRHGLRNGEFDVDPSEAELKIRAINLALDCKERFR